MVVGEAPVVQFNLGIAPRRPMPQGRVKVLTSVDVLHWMGRRLRVGLFNTDKGLLTGHRFGQLGKHGMEAYPDVVSTTS